MTALGGRPSTQYAIDDQHAAVAQTIDSSSARAVPAAPPPPSPRSVEFRAEIGSVPHRDRFTSASRSVRGADRMPLRPRTAIIRRAFTPRAVRPAPRKRRITSLFSAAPEPAAVLKAGGPIRLPRLEVTHRSD